MCVCVYVKAPVYKHAHVGKSCLCAKGIRVYVAAVCKSFCVCESLCVNSPATLYQDSVSKRLCVCGPSV